MKQLILVPVGGLSNRIYTTAAAINFSKKHHLHLIVIWFKNKELGAGFHDLFTLSPDLENVEIRETGFTDFFKFAKPIKSNFFLPKLYQKLSFDAIYYYFKETLSVEDWYLSHPNAQRFYLNHCQKFYDNAGFQDMFRPVSSIQQKIDERVRLLSSHTIGVHMRRTDLVNAIIQSPLSAFVEKMQEEIDKNPETKFYVASDSTEEKKKLKDIFKDRIITVESVLKRNTKQGIVDALVELQTLANTKKIYGSFESTYSSLASEMNGIPLEIVRRS